MIWKRFGSFKLDKQQREICSPLPSHPVHGKTKSAASTASSRARKQTSCGNVSSNPSSSCSRLPLHSLPRMIKAQKEAPYFRVKGATPVRTVEKPESKGLTLGVKSQEGTLFKNSAASALWRMKRKSGRAALHTSPPLMTCGLAAQQSLTWARWALMLNRVGYGENRIIDSNTSDCSEPGQTFWLM